MLSSSEVEEVLVATAVVDATPVPRYEVLSSPTETRMAHLRTSTREDCGKATFPLLLMPP